MYERVIIPTDGSDCAEIGVEEGLYMAKTLEVPALAIYVIDTSEYEGLHHQSIKDSAKRGLKKKGKQALDSVREKAEKWDVELNTEIIVGKPYEKITEQAGVKDVIFISSHGASGWTKLFVGSTTDKVIKNAECTVSVVNGKYSTPPPPEEEL